MCRREKNNNNECMVNLKWSRHWCSLECCINDSICSLPHTWRYFGFSPIDLVQSLCIAHTHVWFSGDILFLLSMSACIHALLWYTGRKKERERGREKKTGDMSWMMFGRERVYSLLFSGKKMNNYHHRVRSGWDSTTWPIEKKKKKTMMTKKEGMKNFIRKWTSILIHLFFSLLLM